MRKLVWSKTLLESYKYVSRIIKSIDRLVVDSSVKSYTIGWGELSTPEQMEQIIDLIERKKRLQSVKLMIEEALKNIDRKSAKILVQHFIDKVDTGKIAAECELNKRTMTRRINKMQIEMMDKMRDLGFGIKKIELLLGNEGWIVGIFNKNAKKFTGENRVEPLMLPQMSGVEKLLLRCCK